MRIQGKLSYLRLLIPVLLLVGAQMFAQTANSTMPAAGAASYKTARPHAGVVLISDRTFLMKSLAGMTMNQSSQTVEPGCSASVSSADTAKSSFIRGCPIVDCAAPPPGCFYQGPPDLGANGCPINCGHLVCGPDAN